jgi:NAD(P)-dependent dehydrogenase (short-subunit alcohol dehydrogenase family)
MRMKDKVSVVTGAASGIGLATLRRLAAEGATIVAGDIADASDSVRELARMGVEARFVQTDVTQASQVETLISETLSSFGRLDVLVNNAGIQLSGKISDTSEADWDRLLDVNLKGVFLCAKATIPIMQRQGGGVVVNVASELGLVGGSEIAAYCASKGGVVQLTKALAVDHAGENIRINCVCPGPVETPLLRSIVESSSDPDEERRSIVEKTLLKRVAQPDEIANVILFLASNESSYMTGSIVVVDGGCTAQ